MKIKSIIPFLYLGIAVCFLLLNYGSRHNIQHSLDYSKKLRSTSLLLQNLYAVSDPFKNPKIDSLRILPLQSEFELVESMHYSEGTFCIFTGKKYGFMNEEGDSISNLLYDFAYPFQEDLACVMKDGKYGFMNKEGKEKIPLLYDKAAPFSEGLAYFELDHTYGFINKNGEEVILLDCDSISSFFEGRALFSKDGKYGFIDNSGQEIIPALYDDASLFKNGLSHVRLGISWGVIDLYGKEVVSPEYDRVELLDDCIQATRNGKTSYFDYSGQEIINPNAVISIGDKKYQIFPTEKSADLKSLLDDDELNDDGMNYEYGVKDLLGKTVISPVYQSIFHIENTDLLIVCQNKKYGIIDMNGNILVPFYYDSISIPDSYSQKIEYVNISLDSKYGILRLSDFTVTIPPTYSLIEPFREDHAIVSSDEKYGLLNKFGSFVIPMGKYDYIFPISDLVICLSGNKGYQLAKNNGELISDTYYSNINPFMKAGAYQQYEINGKRGLLDSLGNEILPPLFDYISSSSEIRGTRKCLIGTNYDSSSPYKDSIIEPEQLSDTDLSETILTNEITPRLQEYRDILLQKELNCIKTTKLYRVDGITEPILYYFSKPLELPSSSASDSTIYGMIHNQATELEQGAECGGTSRGNYVQLFLEKNTGKILLGSSGFYGGFGGCASSNDLYYYQDNKLIKKKEFNWIGQDRHNYSYEDQYLLDHASLFYDSDDLPFHKDTILQSDYLQMYTINNKMVSMDEYKKELSNYMFEPEENLLY